MNNRVDDIFIDAVTVNIVNSFNTLFCILNISIIITVIIPSNMKLLRIFAKISPIKLTLYINSFIQERKINK